MRHGSALLVVNVQGRAAHASTPFLGVSAVEQMGRILLALKDAEDDLVQRLMTRMDNELLLYHAGEIARAVGDDARARDLLGQALAIRGALDPLSASRAQASMDALR